jgi:DinB superfamily
MKPSWKAAVSLCAVLCLAGLAFAQSLSPEDREKGVKYLEQTRQGVIDATKGLSDAQWKFKSAPDRWSVQQCVEHLALAEDFLYQNGVQGALAGEASAPDRDYHKTDAAILTMVPDRTHKAQAPEPLVPSGNASPSDTLDHFLKSRDRSIELMKTSAELRSHVVDSRILGKFDAYEWLIFMSAHSERHTKQILEVKADANFPKN